MPDDPVEWVDEAPDATGAFISALSLPVLYDEWTMHAVGQLADEMQRWHRMEVQVHQDSPVGVIPENERVFLYSAVRKLLFNVVKHAGGSKAHVHLARTDEEAQVIVRDEGKGIKEPGFQSGGTGLNSLRERAEHFNEHVDRVRRPKRDCGDAGVTNHRKSGGAGWRSGL